MSNLVLKSYWRHLKGIRKFGFLTMALYTLAIVARDVFRPYTIKKIVDGVSSHGTSLRYLAWQVFLFGCIHVAAQIFFRSGEFSGATFESRSMRRLRIISLEHLMRHSQGFFMKRQTGSLVTKHKRYVDGSETLFDQINDRFLGILIQITGVMIVMFYVSPLIAIGVIVWIGFFVLNAIFAAKKRVELSNQDSSEESKAVGRFADIISNISIVKMFGSAARELERFTVFANNHYEAQLRSWRFSNRQSVIQGTFSSIMYIGTIGGSVYLWSTYQMSAGDVVLVFLYTGQLSSTLWGFSKDLRTFNQVTSGAGGMVRIMEREPAIQDEPDASTHPVLTPEDAFIEFKDVWFGYGEGKIFKNFNLHIPAGQKVAIVGKTGAGKTTLTALLNRTIDVDEGSISIGPYNIRTSVTQEGLKTLISNVPQTIDVFNRSIRENIGYGKPDATQDKIIAASKKACISEFIEVLPEAYDTMVGERGLKLSGGQRQRLGIARAILHDAPIFIFDEATSSLDNITEKTIQSMFETELDHKTVIVIAHRLTTIRNCDRIVVLKDGAIVQDGTHDELCLELGGTYYEMLHSHDFDAKESSS